MNTPTPEDRERTPAEAAGYIAGTLTGAAEMFMPVRLWITILGAIALVIFAFLSDSPLNITRALSLFVAMTAILLGSAVFRPQKR